ncbi:glycosyltransferase family 2 protein [Rahnella victoriana]|uniref:Glycosyltransferase family 2 protein n=1 Tax=Rahnella victoriana TaxID=1510570 RepID=A0ABS0DKK8_9GAMM|nr:glycosyltransferase family 2 protein [Rahnella victoriana]MBF7954434.1 glycosyltransferase family 2 protein [Rahnella victoriana]
MKNIDVLLATYCGEKFVKEQIVSVLKNFERVPQYNARIIISDDGSTDNTINIINESFWRDKRVIIANDKRLGGVKHNFNFLINNTDADYVFFCDQDDVWLPEKISTFMAAFSAESNDKIPLLVHSDLCVTDGELNPIHPSMFEYQKINKTPSFENIVVSNSITGCVAAINKPLLSLIQHSRVSESIMHDWYAGLIAAAFGRIVFIPQSLILYRQHGSNQVGAQKFTLRKIFDPSFYMKTFHSIKLTRLQAIVFLDDFSQTLDTHKHKALESYISSFDKGFLLRLRMCFFRGFTKYGASRTCAFIFFYVFLGYKIIHI